MSQLEGTAFHEAGHAVAAVIWGLSPLMASIRQHDDALGRVAFPRRGCHDSHTPNPDAHIQAHVVVLAAGEEAEKGLNDGPAPLSEDDRETIALFVEDDEYLERLCRLQAYACVRYNWDAVEAIAAKLLSDKVVAGPTLEKLVEQYRRRPPNRTIDPANTYITLEGQRFTLREVADGWDRIRRERGGLPRPVQVVKD